MSLFTFVVLIVAVVGGSLLYLTWRYELRGPFSWPPRLSAKEGTRQSEGRARYLGKEGTTVTSLRPTGVVEIEDEHIEAVTDGEFIAAGSRVRVVAMDRQHYFVKLADAAPMSPAPSEDR